jgi:hypothetical protein
MRAAHRILPLNLFDPFCRVAQGAFLGQRGP